MLSVLNDYYKENVYNSFLDTPKVIKLAYKTLLNNDEEEMAEIQINFNLDKLQWEECIDGNLVLVNKRNSLEEFINELKGCSFDDIIFDIIYYVYNVLEGDI